MSAIFCEYYSRPDDERLDADTWRYIKGKLKIELGLSTAHLKKYYPTLKKYKILVTVVQENDWYEFDFEGYRIGFSVKTNFFCFSSARLRS
jgi:hypothetical protein